MQVKDVMTRNVEVVAPGDTLEQAARKMQELDVGPMPVCEGNRVVGMLTDRDITVRATAAGCDPKSTLVADVMTQEVIACREDDDVRDAARLMEEKQVRRILVLSREGDLRGIVSLGDLATTAPHQARSGDVLEQVSQPS